MKRFRKIIIALIVISFLGYDFSSYAGLTEDGHEVAEDVRPITLKLCLMIAIRNSFEVKLAKLDYQIAETEKLYSEAVFDTFLFGNVSYNEDKSQQTSVFAPDDAQTNIYSAGITKKLVTGTELSVNLGDTRGWNNSSFSTINPYHNAALTIDAKQPVGKNFFGYIDRTTVTITELAIKNADLATKTRIESFIAEVSKTYWRLVAMKKVLQERTDILNRAEKLHEANTKNFDLGVIEKGDFLASEANLLLRQNDLMVAENNYREVEENLKLLMNVEEEARLVPQESLEFHPASYNLVDCLKEAFANRRDYESSQRDVKINKLNLKMKENAMWPEIDITASLAMNGVDSKFEKAMGRTTVADNTNFTAGIEVTVPVENSQARSEKKKAAYEKEHAIVSLKEVERTIITQVGNAFRKVRTSEASTQNLTKAVEVQSEKLAEEEKRFKYGRSRTKVLIDYQQDLLRTELEETLSLYDFERDKIDLEQSMNVILEKYEDLL